MAETRESREGVDHDAVIRPFARAVERPCARPSCGAPARATLTFRYGTRDARIAPLTEQRDPQAYDLCAIHAARTHPPRGWELRDHRPEDERQPDLAHPTPVDLGGESTVAVLAAALRSVPDPVSEDAVAGHAEVGRVVGADVGEYDVPLVGDDADGPGSASSHAADDADGPGSASSHEADEADATGAAGPADADHGEPEVWHAVVPEPRPPLAVRQRATGAHTSA